MEDGSTFKASSRQILWIVAGVAGLTAIILAGSWLFSPRSTGGGPAAPSGKLSEEQVQKQTFQPEAPQPAQPQAPAAAPLPEPADTAPSSPSGPAQAEASPPPPAPSPEPAPAKPASVPETAKPAAPAPGLFAIQVGAFERQGNAKETQQKLDAKGYKASIFVKGGKYKVLVTGYPDRASADKALAAMRHDGFSAGFVVPQEQP